jgi:hypothetical protein
MVDTPSFSVVPERLQASWPRYSLFHPAFASRKRDGKRPAFEIVQNRALFSGDATWEGNWQERDAQQKPQAASFLERSRNTGAAGQEVLRPKRRFGKPEDEIPSAFVNLELTNSFP